MKTPHTEILDDYPDIVTIRHKMDLEIAAEQIQETLQIIRRDYPDKRLLLVEHRYSYSLSFEAMQLFQEIDYFDRIASLVIDAMRVRQIERSVMWVKFRVPFRVFANRDEAVQFLRAV